MKLDTVVHCPVCRSAAPRLRGLGGCLPPDDVCVVVDVRPQCGAALRPQPGDCCVFCSYGDDLCPPEQMGMADP